jgi:hypothetical protein
MPTDAEKKRAAAEKARRYRERIKLDPSRAERFKLYHHEKYVRRQSEGHLKKINDMTPQEKKSQRLKWRERKKNSRSKVNDQAQNVVKKRCMILQLLILEPTVKTFDALQ